MFFRNTRKQLKLGKDISILLFQVLKNAKVLFQPLHSYHDIVLRRKTKMDLLKVTSMLPVVIMPGTAFILPLLFWMFPILHPSTLTRVETLFKKRVEHSNSCKSDIVLGDECDGLSYLGYKFPIIFSNWRFKSWVDTILEEDPLINIKELDKTEIIECLMERGYYIDMKRDLRAELQEYLDFRDARVKPADKVEYGMGILKHAMDAKRFAKIGKREE